VRTGLGFVLRGESSGLELGSTSGLGLGLLQADHTEHLLCRVLADAGLSSREEVGHLWSVPVLRQLLLEGLSLPEDGVFCDRLAGELRLLRRGRLAHFVAWGAEAHLRKEVRAVGPPLAFIL